MNQLESLDDYLDAMPGGGDPDPDFATRVRPPPPLLLRCPRWS